MITVFCRDEWCKANLHTPDAQVLSQVLGFLKPYYGDLSEQVAGDLEPIGGVNAALVSGDKAAERVAALFATVK